MMKSKLAGVIAAVLIVLSLIVLVIRMNDPGPELVLDLPEFIGGQLAELAAPFLADGGELVLIDSDFPGVTNPYADAYRRGLVAVLGQQAPAATVVDAKFPVDPMALQSGKPIFGSDVLAKLLKEHAQAKVLVSIIGVPEVTRAQAGNWDDSHPRLIVFAPTGGPVDQLVRAGVAQAGIVPRGVPPDDDAWESDDSLKGQFDFEYEVFSASP